MDQAEFLSQLPQHVIDTIGVKAQQLRDEPATDKYHWLKRIYRTADKAWEDIEPDKKAQISCKKGCAFCCHIRVSATPLEADAIVKYCKANNIPINTDRLKEQEKLGTEEYMFSPHKKCVFLTDDNLCSIYPVRPMACRTYFVTNDPADCNTDSLKETSTFFNRNSTIAQVALMLKAGSVDTFPKLILKALNK